MNRKYPCEDLLCRRMVLQITSRRCVPIDKMEGLLEVDVQTMHEERPKEKVTRSAIDSARIRLTEPRKS